MTDLITRDDARRAITFNDAAKEMRANAMFLAVESETVTDPESQAKAVEAQKALADVQKAIEDSRKYVKEPVLQFGREIDAAAKQFLANVIAEATRISRKIGDYQALERAKQVAAEAARNEQLTRLEREKAAELAKAKSLEEVEATHEKFNEAVRTQAPVPVAPRVEGQIVKEEWEFEVTDKRLLAQMHPDLVNIEPRRLDIKERLKIGHKIHGVAARKVVTAGVRATKAKEMLVQQI